MNASLVLLNLTGSSGATSRTIPSVTRRAGNLVAFRDAISLHSTPIAATSTV